MSYTHVTAEPVPCPRCSSQVAPTLLVCPGCGGLMNGGRLKELAAEASRAAEAADLVTEIALWRQALELLPPGIQQHAIISGKIKDLGKRIDSERRRPGAQKKSDPTASGNQHTGAKAGWTAGLVAVGLLLFKFKSVLILLLTKGKLLLLGLTKLSTLGSMLISLSVYWSLWGWKFALGIIGSIYIHEMGHVSELRKYGFRASAPTFIPGLGALIRLQQHPVNGREDARVGLAGPLWGLGAALAAAGVYFATDAPFWGAIARVGAWINLFNLVPVASLDGARGFRALNRTQRLLVAATFAGCWLWVHDGLLLILAIVSGGVALFTQPSDEPDVGSAVTFLALIVVLSSILQIPLNLEAAGLR